jgi:hypothetical protein
MYMTGAQFSHAEGYSDDGLPPKGMVWCERCGEAVDENEAAEEPIDIDGITMWAKVHPGDCDAD